MNDPRWLSRNQLSRLLVMRNGGLFVAGLATTFIATYRVGAGSWPVTGGGGEGEVIVLSRTVLVVLGLALAGVAYLLRGKLRILLAVVLAVAALIGLLAFAQWAGVGLVMQAVWLLVALAAGCGILGVWAGRIVWYARRPKRWERRLARIAGREARKAEPRPSTTVVEVIEPAPPLPRRPAAATVIDPEELDAICLSDGLVDEPADQWGR